MKKVDKKIEYEFNSRTCVLQFINSQARKVNKKSSEILQKTYTDILRNNPVS